MGSNKAFLLLGLSVAIVLLISSEVAARELAETQTTTTNKNTEAATVDGRGGYNEGYNGGGGYHNGGGGYHNGGGGYHNGGGGYHNGGGGYHNGGGGYHNGGGGYHNGGGGGGCHHGHCRYRCCNYAGEVVDAETTEVKPHN